MWVFLSGSFLSIVAHNDRPSYLMVRARLRGDIERVFPHVEVRETPVADYRFRAEVHRSRVAEEMKSAVLDITYTNFKKSVPDVMRHHAYLRVWNVMADEQEIARQVEVDEKAMQRGLYSTADLVTPKRGVALPPVSVKKRLGRALAATPQSLNPRGKRPARPR